MKSVSSPAGGVDKQSIAIERYVDTMHSRTGTGHPLGYPSTNGSGTPTNPRPSADQPKQGAANPHSKSRYCHRSALSAQLYRHPPATSTPVGPPPTITMCSSRSHSECSRPGMPALDTLSISFSRIASAFRGSTVSEAVWWMPEAVQ